jgi:CheY-like chemotaxis protein
MKRLLLVEDWDEVRELFREILESAGYEVHSTASAADAIARVESGVFDLIVSDVRLPDGNGFDVAAKAEARGMKILLVTGYPGLMHEVELLGRPHLRKPIRPAELLKAIDEQIRK